MTNVTSTNSTFSQVTLRAHAALLDGTFTMSIGGQPIQLNDPTTKTYSLPNIPYNSGANSIELAIRQIAGF